jgi:hypothetical protein
MPKKAAVESAPRPAVCQGCRQTTTTLHSILKVPCCERCQSKDPDFECITKANAVSLKLTNKQLAPLRHAIVYGAKRYVIYLRSDILALVAQVRQKKRLMDKRFRRG